MRKSDVQAMLDSIENIVDANYTTIPHEIIKEFKHAIEHSRMLTEGYKATTVFEAWARNDQQPDSIKMFNEHGQQIEWLEPYIGRLYNSNQGDLDKDAIIYTVRVK